MGYPFWIRLKYRNDVGRVIGFTGSILSESDLLDVLARYEITRSNLVTVYVNGKTYTTSRLESIFVKLESRMSEGDRDGLIKSNA
ncbi:hypothetical protein [Thermaerobacillus caldiproteolyticus]|uniref:hypothetical protein n=1 Tax=Thermaerobacillus caldiproteolyticus TaxID=247480 RepID=UPI0018F1FCC5|nr:hypothetical protein [Anoxybacillus caldiproteolyticus]